MASFNSMNMMNQIPNSYSMNQVVQNAMNPAPAKKPLSEEKDQLLSQLSEEQTRLEKEKGSLEYGEYDRLRNQMLGLSNQARDQAASSQNIYQNTILPNMKNYMDSAAKEAGSAMTLKESMDPNNTVAASFRKFYDTQAQSEGKRGLADVGVLQAMGTQSLANQLGNGQPVTGAQMQLLQSGFQSQAGQAFANVQKRMQQLRDQGLEQGWAQTDKAYERGQAARDRYGQSIGMQSDLENAYTQRMGLLRGEQAGYGREATDAGLSGISSARDPAIRGLQRQAAIKSGTFDTQMQQEAANQQAADARQLARMQGRSAETAGWLGALGSIAGGIAGR